MDHHSRPRPLVFVVAYNAEKTIQSTLRRIPSYNEVGRFDEALSTGRQALALAERQGNGGAMAQLATRILLFGSREKLREAR